MQSSAIFDWFLEKSQNCGLEIEVCNTLGGRFDEVLRNFGKLVACVNRWHSLDFFTPWERDLPVTIAHFHDLCAPNLKLFSISCSYAAEPQDKALTTTIFTGGTPALKSLSLFGVSSFPNSLNTLTSLSLLTFPDRPLLFPSYTRFREHLMAMCSLVHLECIGRIIRWPSMQAVKAVDLPSLRSLTIARPEHNVSVLCATLPTATLHHFCLVHVTNSSLSSLLRYMRKGTLRFPHVKLLTWSMYLSNAEDVHTIVESFPVVENLTVIESPSDGFNSLEMDPESNSLVESDSDISESPVVESASNSFLEVLLRHDRDPSTNGHLWPHLRTLNLQSSWDTIVLLRDFVAIRITMESPIRKVRIHDRMPQDLAETEEVKWLRTHARLEFVSQDFVSL